MQFTITIQATVQSITDFSRLTMAALTILDITTEIMHLTLMEIQLIQS